MNKNINFRRLVQIKYSLNDEQNFVLSKNSLFIIISLQCIRKKY